MRTLRSVVFAAVAAAGCLSAGATGPRLVGEGRAVLFIGNSYTYVNDLPGIVQALADSAGGEKIAVETVAEPDFALVDHWAVGTAQKEIAKGGWAFVVLQQGPSSVDVNRDTLRLATKLFASGIAAVGAKPALFSAWPTSDRRVDYPRAIESYRLAAADVNGVFLPVASAWLEAWGKDPTLPLYAPDGLHASGLGSYVAALAIYAKLTGKPVVGLPAALRLRSGAVLSINSEVARKVQEAVSAVVGGETDPRGPATHEIGTRDPSNECPSCRAVESVSKYEWRLRESGLRSATHEIGKTDPSSECPSCRAVESAN